MERKVKQLKSISDDTVVLEVYECICGFHLGIDATYLDQVTDVKLPCPVCGAMFDTTAEAWIDENKKEPAVKYFKTTITVEVLSNELIVPDSLEDIHNAITAGDCSGIWNIQGVQELTERQMAAALAQQGSDPGFLIPEDTS